MRRARDPGRTPFAAFVTGIVVALLGSACLSITSTDNYDLFSGGVKTPYDAPVWGDASLDDAGERIRVLLSAAHHPATSHVVAVNASSNGAVRGDVTHGMAPDRTREVFLAIGAVVFASFGLFVLWWGRDRASLWLGIFCVSFGTPMVQLFGVLPPPGMLAASLVDGLLEIVSIYALFALAEAVADEALAPGDVARRPLPVVRWIAASSVTIMALVFIGTVLLPVIPRVALPQVMARIGAGAGTFAEVVVLTLAPLALLALAALRARDAAARSRALIILATTAVALIGVIYSLATTLAHGGSPQFDSFWFSLLFIPVGFIVTISTYRVVEVRFIVNRILVLAVMTVIIGAAMAASETLLTGSAERMVAGVLGRNPPAEAVAPRDALSLTVDFIIACAIVLSFSTLHRVVDEIVKRFVFRRRDEGVAALREFAVHRASFVTARKALLDQAVALVRESVGARSAAIYQECTGGYECAASHGDATWPAVVGIDDSVFVSLRSDADQVDLAALTAIESALGSDGIAVRMAIGGRVTGALVVLSRGEDGDGPYVREERDAFDEISRGVADALFALRSNETASFVRAVADGAVSGAEASRRARALCDCDEPAQHGPPIPLGRVETVRSTEAV